MNTILENQKSSEEATQDLIDGFQILLQAFIAAEQSDRTTDTILAESTAACADLAQLPNEILAHELATPARAIVDEINRLTFCFEKPQHAKILYQLDHALALISEVVSIVVRRRAKTTQCPNLLFEYLADLCQTDPSVPKLTHRYETIFNRLDDWSPETAPSFDVGCSMLDVGCSPVQPNPIPAENMVADFIRDTYRRVQMVADLAELLPEHARPAAQDLPAWPTLAYFHTPIRPQIRDLACRLELGLYSPLDTSPDAKYDPDSPLVRYLDPLVCNLANIQVIMQREEEPEAPEEERKRLAFWWRNTWHETPSDQTLNAAVLIKQLPPLSKATAAHWAEKLIVPIMLAGDARDWKNCAHPALRAIATQSGVRTAATFQSRLRATITTTLHQLACPPSDDQ